LNPLARDCFPARRFPHGRASRFSFAACVLCAALLGPAEIARADRVQMRDGREITGLVQSVGDEYVEMESVGGWLRLPRESVERVEPGAPADNALIRAGFVLRRAQGEAAAEMLRQALMLEHRVTPLAPSACASSAWSSATLPRKARQETPGSMS